MNRKTLTIAVIGVVVGGAFILLRGPASMDRVDQHFAEAKELGKAALSWIPFEKSLMGEARDISLSSDIDTNQFVIRWKYLEPSALAKFQDGLSKVSSKNETIDCAKEKRPECEAMSKVDGMIGCAEVPQDSDKSFWIFDPSTNRVLGSSHIPLPPHLK